MLVLAWQSLCAALLPIRLDEIPHALDRFLAHLGRSSDGARDATLFAFNATDQLREHGGVASAGAVYDGARCPAGRAAVVRTP